MLDEEEEASPQEAASPQGTVSTQETVSMRETDSPSAAAQERLPGIHKYFPLITLLVCTALSIIFLKTGLLSLFFLVPIGYVIIISGSFMPIFITAAVANIILIIIQSFSMPDISNTPVEVLYLTTVLFGFTWIMGGKFMRTAYRFVIASSVCAVIFLIFINSPASSFFEMFSKTVEEFFGGGADSEVHVKNLLFSQTFTPARLMELAKMFLLRGGALISMFFLFFVNRQVAISIVSMVKKQKIDRGLTSFSAPANAIWVLSGALATIVLSGIFKMEILATLAWNVFSVCGIIFLAQGAAILMYWMSFKSNGFRLIINVLIIVVLFSPLNSFAIAALVLLGIIDNWRPFRIAKSTFR
ncbi:hypothetical protein R84B8_01352 [Treponema sp. R8-4-B8]